MARLYYVNEHFKPKAAIVVATDASAWGLGAVLYIGGTLVAALHSAIAYNDDHTFGYKRGDEHGQQCWETLALLVALRHWRNKWEHARVELHVRSDSMAALTTLASLKAKSSNS